MAFRLGALLGGLLGAAALALPASAAGEYKKPESHSWSFSGIFGTYDQEALQRGYQVYSEVCAACHSMNYLSFRHLGQRHGPFYDSAYPNPNDNPVVKALAARAMVEDIDDIGDTIQRPGRTSDTLPHPFPNETAARAANGGAYPPDMSVIIKARKNGANYIRSLMLGYADPPAGLEVPAGSYYNPYFPGDLSANWTGDPDEVPKGGLIAMPPQLWPEIVAYDEGQPEATPEQMAEDVVAFLQWSAQPYLVQQKQMGFQVLLYLGLLAILLWFAYKQVWRNVKH